MSLSEPDAAFLAGRNLTFLFARRPRAVTSASFAKLAEPSG